MDTGLKNKCALITGGSSGIGKGIAIALAKEGVNLAIASRNPDDKVIEQLKDFNVNCFKIKVDVTKENEIISMVNEAINGLGSLDIFINNAAWTWHQPVTKITDEAWQSTINTNLRACVFACREISKYMIPQKKGNIIIIGSTVRFFPAYTETSYRISKMGLKMYMETLAIELAPYGIRVNMVTPGLYITKMTADIPENKVKRLHDVILCHRSGDPIEIGNGVAFLASDLLSPYTYGTDLIIDGGVALNPLSLKTKDEIYKLNI